MLDTLLRDRSDMLNDWDLMFIHDLKLMRRKQMTQKQVAKLEQLYRIIGYD